MELASFGIDSQNGITTAMDIIESLQGVFVFIIFVLHNPVKSKLIKILGLKCQDADEEELNNSEYKVSYLEHQRFLENLLRHTNSVNED